jgi:pimeloyl-ACP methyl ester carboxylesterase
MNAKLRRRLRWFVQSLVMIYIAGGILLYFFQDILIFHPAALARDHHFSFDQPFEEYNIPVGKNNLSLIKFRTAEERKGIVLFFHGNMNNVEHYRQYPFLFTRNAYEVWMIDYPGFGKTSGERSEKVIDEEALVMYDLAAGEINPDSIILYGKSIGTGIAAYVAANRRSKQLILETPYYNFNALAKHNFPIYPVGLLRRYSFPTNEYLNKVNCPVTIFHGTDDGVIPYTQARRLAAAHRNTELITIEKGKHNDLFDFDLFQEKMDSVLER